MTEAVVAILNAMGFTTCFTVACALAALVIIKNAVARNAAHEARMGHIERMERLRLSNTKEITHGD